MATVSADAVFAADVMSYHNKLRQSLVNKPGYLVDTLAEDTLRFNELKRRVGGISQQMLTDRS